MPIPADQIDPDARKVLRRLVGHNFQAYLVGGCVRDLLLSRTPKDFDIATSATPNEVKSLFRNCRIIGRRFRLAHIFFGPKIIETATFRANPRDAESEDVEVGERAEDDLLIRRDNVFGNAEEDARRRDFTINGLFYDIEADQVIDYVGGLNDLAERVVRTIGDPDIRFREDPVRILRAIKFAARLGFDIDPQAWLAIRTHQGELSKCAPPRLLEEIYRLMRGGAARRSFELLNQTGILEILVPEVAALFRDRPDSDEAKWLWRVFEGLDARREPVPANAVLLCALAGPMLGDAIFDEGVGGRGRDVGQLVEERMRPMLERMRVSRRDIERARQILLAQRRIAPSKRKRGKAQNLLRRDYFEESLQVFELVGQAIRPDPAGLEEVASWRRLLRGEPGQEGAAQPGMAEAQGDAGQRRRRRRRGGRRGGSGYGSAGADDASNDTMLDDDDSVEDLAPLAAAEAGDRERGAGAQAAGHTEQAAAPPSGDAPPSNEPPSSAG